MNHFRFLWLFAFVAGAALAPAQVELEKPNPPATAPSQSATNPSQPATEPTAPAPVTSPAPAPPAMPPPAEPPRESNPIGLLILAVILAHVCLPLGVIITLVVLLIILKLYRGGIMKIVMGLAAAGGARVIKKILVTIGCLIVLPAGFLGLNWAAKWMDHRLSGATWFIYGLVVSVLTGLVFFSIMKAIARTLKKRLGGKMGGMMGSMGGMGGFDGMGGLGGLMGGTRDKPRGKKRR